MRKVFAIAAFFIYFNAAALLIEATGVTKAWGVESPTGVTPALDKAQRGLQDINASGGLSDTLFGSFTAGAGAIEALGRAVFAGPLLLSAAGVPDVFVVFLFAPAGLIVGRGIIHVLTGRLA